MHISQKVLGVKMCNLRDSIFYKKTNILQHFHICISVSLRENLLKAVFIKLRLHIILLQSKMKALRNFVWYTRNSLKIRLFIQPLHIKAGFAIWTVSLHLLGNEHMVVSSKNSHTAQQYWVMHSGTRSFLSCQYVYRQLSTSVL